MKSIRILGLASSVAMLTAGSAWAALIPPPNPNDWTQGKWELNVAKSKFCAPANAQEKPVQKATRDIVDMGWGMILVTMNTTREGGQPNRTRYLYRYDGQKYPGGGIDSAATEAITWKQVGATRVEFQHWSKDNKETADYVRTVSVDGQTMTQTAKYLTRSCNDESQVFDRRP